MRKEKAFFSRLTILLVCKNSMPMEFNDILLYTDAHGKVKVEECRQSVACPSQAARGVLVAS